MRNLLIFFLGISLFSFCSSKTKTEECPYYKLITSNFGTSSHFISADIIGPDSSFTVVLTNYDLYIDLFGRRVKEQDYTQNLIDHWKRQEPLTVDTVGQRSLRYTSIKKDKELENLLTLSKDQIITRYVDKSILKSGKLDESKVIYCLIKLGAPCRRDDISGYVVLQDTVIDTNCK